MEVVGQQSGKQLWAAPTAGLQGTGEGKEGDAVLSHILEPRCPANIVFTQSSVPGNEKLV